METFLSNHCGDDENISGDRGENNSTENQCSDDTMFQRNKNRTVAGRRRRRRRCPCRAEQVQPEERRRENVAEDERGTIQVCERRIETREIVGEKTVHRIDEHRDE